MIATNIGSIPEVVENGLTGYLVPPKDSEVLADAITKVLKDDELRRQMGVNMYKKAQELSWDSIINLNFESF